MCYLCTRKTDIGTLAERLGNGLQNRVEQFDSARHLIEGEEYYCSSLFAYTPFSSPLERSGVVRQVL